MVKIIMKTKYKKLKGRIKGGKQMRIRKILVQMLIAVMVIMTLALINGGEVKAALQANTSTHYKKTDTMANWLPAFRNMEATRRSNGLKRDD